MVEQGIFDIYVDRKVAPRLVASRSTGESFGELALMYNSPRSATVIARTPCKVWAVERYMFRKILIRVSDDKLREYEGFLKHVKLLDSLLANERRAVAEALDELKFKEGDKIVKQGEQGDTFYLIRKGKAKVWKSDVMLYCLFFLFLFLFLFLLVIHPFFTNFFLFFNTLTSTRFNCDSALLNCSFSFLKTQTQFH